MPERSLISKASVKRYALDISERYKKGKFTIVSEAFLNEVEEHVRVYVFRKVQRHPFKGKTLKPEMEE